MKKPSDTLFKLEEIGVIRCISIDYELVTEERAETFCNIIGSLGECSGNWSDYKKYLNVAVGFNSIAEIKKCYIDELLKYKKFEKENKKELKEYERLKLKFS